MLKTFKLGGVHPAENKISSHQAIREIPLPKRVFIPVSQHLGAPSKVIVQNGEVVRTGQLIARGESFISSNIHSPVSGKVFKVDEVIDISGYRKQAVIIDVDGDEWVETIDRSDEIKWEVSLSPKEIIDRVSQMGIVGMGGATFPSHVKLMVPEGRKVDTLIINGVECEPYLTSDHRLMLERGEEVLIGAFILMKALQVEKVIIGIERNKPDAIAHISDLCKKFPGFVVQPLKAKYPQGGEKQLIKAVLNREVP
ncbi:MAG: RnfABCDGE type electron transport complex subunit C, partial [Bacteroidales bacterium]|nr:RnfABCDGE type electron transport complex subunit C [Bacteroidales bacterium]